MQSLWISSYEAGATTRNNQNQIDEGEARVQGPLHLEEQEQEVGWDQVFIRKIKTTPVGWGE